MNCEMKFKWRIYATPKRHIQNLRKTLRNPQKIKKGVFTPRQHAFCLKPLITTYLIGLINKKKHICSLCVKISLLLNI